jgi:hypothetical protein
VERPVSGPPILVTGAHRSGTTWVGHTLAAGGELGYIEEPFSVLHRPGVLPVRFRWWFPYVTAGSANGLREPVRRMLGFHYDAAAEVRALRSPRDAGRLVRDAARTAASRAKGRRPLVKDPVALLSAPWLADEFGMQVVVLIRHPAAFAGSLKRMGWTHPFADFLAQPELMAGPLSGYRDRVTEYALRPPDVVDQAALLWAMLHTVIAGYRDDRPDCQFVRHEDISREPEQRFRELCDALGLRFDGAVAEHDEASTGSRNPAEAAEGRAHTLRRDSAANVSTGRSRLSADEVDLVRRGTDGAWQRFYVADEW